MAAARKTVDWANLSSKLKPETYAAVQAFRGRQAALNKQVADLKEQLQPINFTLYEATIKNATVVQEAKKALGSFKAASYPLDAQLKVVEESRKAAVSAAKKTEDSIQGEMKTLKDLLVNIETCRPINELTVEDVAKAYPKLDATVEKMAKRGQWRVPGYYEKFGEFSVGF